MATYTYPAMPLIANVWWASSDAPPSTPPDELDVACSLSPISPIQLLTGLINTELSRQWTHIIRTAVAPNVVDSFSTGREQLLFPMAFYEIPAGSGHFYQVLWAHVVGAGFDNEHARIFACRWTTGLLADLPWFRGWI